MIQLANPRFGREEQDAVRSVLQSGMVADGPEVRRFESEFASYCGSEHAVATANGTAALVTALEALDIGDGNRVVTTPFSFVASANAIRLVGAEPVFADIKPETFNLDPTAAREMVRRADADAILVVHLYGLPADMGAFERIAAEEDVLLIEDAAQAHGAAVDGQSVGTFGDAAAFSFYPTKNMTTGEGGMVLTDRADVAERAASYVNHGRTPGGDSYAHERVGHNLRLTSLAAAIGCIQLESLPGWIEDRRTNADRLTAGLTNVSGVQPPVEPEDRRHAYHQYTIRCDDRSRVQAHLEDREIGSAVYYPSAIHELEAYEEFDVSAPAAADASESVLSLPVHPGLTATDVDEIVQAVRSARLEIS